MKRTMLSSVIGMILAVAFTAYGGDWNPRLAAEYLDGRQKDWFAWPTAKAAGGPCISCHTGVTYLLARPALRKTLGESQPTQYETGLLDGLRERADKKERMFGASAFGKEPLLSQGSAIESIFTALFLAQEDRSGTLSQRTEQAFDRMWTLQNSEGKAKGGWSWFQFGTDPWETQESAFYGAALAAFATGATPASYKERPDVREHLNELTAYLQNSQEAQPLHNRMMLLWASAALPGLLPEPAHQRLVEEVLAKQQKDGGWTIESLGPWKEHPDAVTSTGSNSYATAVVAFTLEKAGVATSNPHLAKAIHWLKARQDRRSGYWDASSMNKHYPAGSMPELFMRDAATGFAVLALIEADEHVKKGSGF